jgi:hypothetical protein
MKDWTVTDLDSIPDVPKPSDYDAYRPEISGCTCLLCVEMAYFRPLDVGGRELLHAARVLLAALRAGTHVRRTFAEHVAAAKAAKAARFA